MHDTADLGCRFLTHDLESVFSSLPRMNNERFADLSGGTDMRAKALPLPPGVALDPVVVQAGFPDGDHLGVISQADQSIDVRFFARSVVRVNAGGGKYVGEACCDRQDLGKGFQVHGNAKRMGHAVCCHGPGDPAQIGSQFGEIDVTV